MSILFKGDNKALIISINALLALDAKGSLVPHGIGEMARDLLETCAARLPAEQHQGEPVAYLISPPGCYPALVFARNLGNPSKYAAPLYTHADPGEVERLARKCQNADLALKAQTQNCNTLRAQLAEQDALLARVVNSGALSSEQHEELEADCCVAVDVVHQLKRQAFREHLDKCAALSASAETSAQIEIDEPTDLATWKRRAIEAESKLRTYDPQVVELGEQAMQAMLAEPKPSEVVLTKCKLCDQLQADLTARDEKLDQTQDLLRYMVYDYRSVVQAGYDRITALGSNCDSVAKMLDDNPNYQKALALLMPDLESRPEERGTPETEPCSSCGTPGWTGACNKCVPY